MQQPVVIAADSMSELTTIVVVVVIWLVLWFGIKLWFFSKEVVAEILPEPGVPFELRFHTEVSKKMSVRFEFDLSHGGGERDFGVVVDLLVDINGQITKDVVGIGNEIHMPVNRTSGSFLMGEDSGSLNGARSKATVILARLVLNTGNEVHITGTVHLELETHSNRMRLYVVK